MSSIFPNNVEKNSRNSNQKSLIFALLSLLILLISLFYFLKIEKKSYFADLDKDGYGNKSVFIVAKFKPSDYVSDSSDTDDSNPCIPDSAKCSKSLGGTNPPGSTSTGMGINTGSGTNPPGGTSAGMGVKSGMVTGAAGGSISPNERIFYLDQDGDGLGDKNLSMKSLQQPDKYVTNFIDECPNRKGDHGSSNGCPSLSIKGETISYLAEYSDLNVEYNDSKDSDQIKWKGSDELKFQYDVGKEIKYQSGVVGKYKVEASVENTQDNFRLKASLEVQVKIKDDHLAKELMNLAEYGNFLLMDINDLKSKRDKSILNIEKHIENEEIKLTKRSKSSGNFKITYKDYIAELMSAKRSNDTHIRKITISNIQYHESTGKIISFTYENN